MLDLGRQYMTRLRAWLEELPNHLYTPVGEMTVEGMTTMERLKPAKAERGAFRPFAEGEKWGACLEYGWFRGDIVLPGECEGRRVILLGNVGGEQLYYVNGRAVGAVDKEHRYVTLTRNGKAGETFHVLIESYAGHGARLESGTPTPPERHAVPPCPEKQVAVGKSVVAVWNEDAYQLLMDATTLAKLLQVLPEESLRAMKVAKALEDFMAIADFELPFAERHESFRQAREALREALDCHNGSTAPLMWVIGQSHIDLAWLWPLEETYHKSVRTYSNQMELLDEYPEYQWLLCEPALLEMLKEMDPELWGRVKEAYRRGQIRPEGAFYVECDTNLPSGESLIRQLMWGKKWYKEEFGVDTQVGWLPDCFGFSAALPQIFRKMGIPYFATQKLQRADPECEGFLYHHFKWEGIDGSEVLTLSFMKDNGPIDPVSFSQRWKENRVQKTEIDMLLHPFGYGDGGGGPTRDMVEMSLRLKDLEGVPRSQYGGLREYFDIVKQQRTKNRWVGELYLAWHRGTFTSQRRAKALMRRAEFALHDVEALAARSARPETYKEEIDRLWKILMTCQFHDVAGGVGIRKVHEDAERDLEHILDAAGDLKERLWREILRKAGPSLFNHLSWDRKAWVRVEGRYRQLRIPAGSAVCIGEGWEVPTEYTVEASYDGSRVYVNNGIFYAIFESDGSITQLTDLRNDAALLGTGRYMNVWKLYKNVQTTYDGWELDRNWEDREIPGAVKSRIVNVLVSPEVCEIIVSRTFGNSEAQQVIRIFAGSDQIFFETDVNWQERHRMLKTHFNSLIVSENAIHEIQFGYVERPAHRSTRFASDRYEVPNHRYSALCEDNRGFAVLNDGCYGISSDRGELALTLLRAPLVPDEENNRGRHHFTYALYVFDTPFAQSQTVRRGYELNSPPEGCFGDPDWYIRGFRVQEGNVILETIKPAEDGNGVILRLYNSQRTREKAVLELPYYAGLEVAGMDEAPGYLLDKGQKFTLEFGPFEIRTYRVIREEGR